MNKKSFTKRILAVALSLIMVLGLLPMTAFAYPGNYGETLTSNDPGQFDMDGRPLLVFVTPDGGAVSRTKGGNSDSSQQFTARANNGWAFKYWHTYYEGITSDAEHIVVVEDHAGNKTTYTVTVYKNYTVTFKADGNTVDTQTVGHGKDATVPVVPSKDGYTGKWDHDGKNITADVVINAVYTKNSASVPSDPQSPQTGDNSSLWLWAAFLFVSGGALLALTVYNRKRRII